MNIPDIKTQDIVDWQEYIEAKKLNYKSKEYMLICLRILFNYCIEIEEIITISPIKKRIKFTNNEVKKDMLIYEPEEYLKFRSAIKKPLDIIIFDILYYTGMRKGEMLALKWEDFKDDTLRITKTYARKNKKLNWRLTPPKSKNSVRNIMLPKFLVEELNAYKNSVKASDTGFIIGDEFPNSEQYINNARDRIYIKAGVKRIRIHDFRHSHVSYLIGCNTDIVSISKRIGDSVTTVLRTYAQLLQDKQQAILDNLEAISPSL